MKVQTALMHTLVVSSSNALSHCIDVHMKMAMLHEDPHDESMQLINKWPW